MLAVRALGVNGADGAGVGAEDAPRDAEDVFRGERGDPGGVFLGVVGSQAVDGVEGDVRGAGVAPL